jgi:hypothetical protein
MTELPDRETPGRFSEMNYEAIFLMAYGLSWMSKSPKPLGSLSFALLIYCFGVWLSQDAGNGAQVHPPLGAWTLVRFI